MEPLTRRTARMLIRPIVEADRAEYLRVHEVSAAHFKPWTPATDLAVSADQAFTRLLEEAGGAEAAGTAVRRIGVLDDGRIAGVFALSQIARGPFLSCYAGWRVSVEVLGQGLCTEAMRAMLDMAFAPAPDGLGLHRVQANVIPGNGPSLRVAEKLGLRREGLALRYLQIDGRWQDHVMFAIVADEFRRGGAHDQQAGGR
jgi:[ribosomal protein S5]-alanine N-acetyltransferase